VSYKGGTAPKDAWRTRRARVYVKSVRPGAKEGRGAFRSARPPTEWWVGWRGVA